MRTVTRQSVLDHIKEHIRRAVIQVVVDIWLQAEDGLQQGDPTKLVLLLKGEWHNHKKAANAQPGPREMCSSPARARGEASIKAREIAAMLDNLAEQFGEERIWGEDRFQRQAERILEVDGSGFTEDGSRDMSDCSIVGDVDR